jgi:hypothetical protein
MNRNKLNKKLVNNLILGSFLLGVFDGIITQVQGTQQPSFSEEMADSSMKRNAMQLEDLLFRNDIPMDQRVKLIKEKQMPLIIGVGLLNLLGKAIAYSNVEIVEFLLREGIGMNQQDNKNNPLLYITVCEKKCSLLHMAVWDHQSINGFIKRRSSLNSALRLLRKEPKSNQQEIDELSNISYASPEIVKLLLKAGLKADEKDEQGKTPLDLAKQRRDETSDRNLKSRYDVIVKYLEQAMASPSK